MVIGVGCLASNEILKPTNSIVKSFELRYDVCFGSTQGTEPTQHKDFGPSKV